MILGQAVCAEKPVENRDVHREVHVDRLAFDAVMPVRIPRRHEEAFHDGELPADVRVHERRIKYTTKVQEFIAAGVNRSTNIGIARRNCGCEKRAGPKARPLALRRMGSCYCSEKKSRKATMPAAISARVTLPSRAKSGAPSEVNFGVTKPFSIASCA